MIQVGSLVKVADPQSAFYGCVGRVTSKRFGLARVKFDEGWGYFDPDKLVSPDTVLPPLRRVPITEIRSDGTIPDTVLKARERLEIQRALVGDCGPAPNGDEFETWLLGILAMQERREREEGGTSHE